MKLRKPDYYDRFQCIAGACSDSCCIGWEIDIDEEQKQLYAQFAGDFSEEDSARGELGRQMRSCIDWEEDHFILQGKEERCPFLNQENLCDLIIGLGEESLCDICREHPRFYDWFDDLTEVGLGLCCEAAGRLILEREEPVKFVTEQVAAEDDDAEDVIASEEGAASEENTISFNDVKVYLSVEAEGEQLLFSARETAIRLLQNRNESIWRRLVRFLDYVEELQEGLEFGSLDVMEEIVESYENITGEPVQDSLKKLEYASREERVGIYRGLLNICRELEPIDESWSRTLLKLESLVMDAGFFSDFEEAMLQDFQYREYEYEHLAVYFVYRYFMKCREDSDLHSRGCLMVFCLLLIRLLDVQTYRLTGQVTKEDRVQNAKCISKEIEYSEENLELLAEMFWEREEVSVERLKRLLEV